MSVNWRHAALAHARHEYPQEACGLVVDDHYWPARNCAITAEDHFILDPHDYAAAEACGEVSAIFHSHPDAPAEPSAADRSACTASGLPWHIVSLPDEQWASCEPRPLLGREFVHGVTDCYSLIRDWYRIERGITLPDFARDDEWWKHGGDLYMQHFVEAGFRLSNAADAQPGDVLLMNVLSPVPNHGAIWLAGDQIIHHLYGRLSCRESYDGRWRERTTHWLRHVSTD